jgi:hypothetical protein
MEHGDHFPGSEPPPRREPAWPEQTLPGLAVPLAFAAVMLVIRYLPAVLAWLR